LALLVFVVLALTSLVLPGCRREVEGEAKVIRMDADGIVIEVRSIANAQIEFGANEFTGHTDDSGVGTLTIPLQYYLQDKYSQSTASAEIAVVKRIPLLRTSSYHKVKFPMTPLAAKDVPAGAGAGPWLRLGSASQGSYGWGAKVSGDFGELHLGFDSNGKGELTFAASPEAKLTVRGASVPLEASGVGRMPLERNALLAQVPVGAFGAQVVDQAEPVRWPVEVSLQGKPPLSGDLLFRFADLREVLPRELERVTTQSRPLFGGTGLAKDARRLLVYSEVTRRLHHVGEVATVGQARLVAVGKEKARKRLASCTGYEDLEGNPYSMRHDRVDVTVSVRDPRTGKEVARRAFVGGDSRCPAGGLVGKPFVDYPEHGKITAWLGEVLTAAK